MEALTHLLEQSISQYQNYLDKLTDIKNRIGELNNTEVVERSEEMASLMEEIKKKDLSVNRELHSQAPSPLQLALHEKRLALMMAINECNEQLTAQVQGIIAVQKTEISKIRSGRESMNGYSPQLKKTGGRINSNA
ncbi:MAG: hypothetical protein OEV64_14240 [Desulfobulbaceae bacterium]|nr:hypothetical protein [Desulfobulbaceae bacterium]